MTNTHDNLIRYGADGNPTYIGWFDDFGGPNPYAALSNFYVGAPLTFPLSIIGTPTMRTVIARTGEHLFAAAKAWNPADPVEFLRILYLDTPQEAKTAGRLTKLRPDWEAVKYDVMMAVLRLKFTLDRYEGHLLLRTGQALLVEGTYWNDTVWGVDLDEPSLYGRNWLGTMLMARRAELVASREAQRAAGQTPSRINHLNANLDYVFPGAF